MAVDYAAVGEEMVELGAEPEEIIDRALTDFGLDCAIAFSGAEDVVLIEYASRTGKPFRVFALDTGRLHPETYRFFDKVEKHYGIRIEYCFPESKEVEDLVNEKGMFSFLEDGHQECCRIRKVRPLRKKLGTLKAWITGQRKDQSPGTRQAIPVIEMDPAFKGQEDSELVKFNPLANVSSAEVWALIRMVEVPYNELHQKGFISIGCEPCTIPVLPNQHEREGRWAYEEATQKECGLHTGNISKDLSKMEEARNFVLDRVNANNVMMFSKAGCPFCLEARELLEKLDIEYFEETVSEMPNVAEIMAALEEKTNQKTLPNIFIKSHHIGGCAELKVLHATGELVEMVRNKQLVQ